MIIQTRWPQDRQGPISNKQNTTVHEVAATNRNEGTIDILDHTDHGGHNHVVLDSENVKLRPSQNLVPVPARTLDSYNFKDVNAIKIDVEGSELLVMQGAKDTKLPTTAITAVSDTLPSFKMPSRDSNLRRISKRVSFMFGCLGLEKTNIEA